MERFLLRLFSCYYVTNKHAWRNISILWHCLHLLELYFLHYGYLFILFLWMMQWIRRLQILLVLSWEIAAWPLQMPFQYIGKVSFCKRSGPSGVHFFLASGYCLLILGREKKIDQSLYLYFYTALFHQSYFIFSFIFKPPANMHGTSLWSLLHILGFYYSCSIPSSNSSSSDLFFSYYFFLRKKIWIEKVRGWWITRGDVSFHIIALL